MGAAWAIDPPSHRRNTIQFMYKGMEPCESKAERAADCWGYLAETGWSVLLGVLHMRISWRSHGCVQDDSCLAMSGRREYLFRIKAEVSLDTGVPRMEGRAASAMGAYPKG